VTAAALRIPLFAKLLGANAIIVFFATLALWGPAARVTPGSNGSDYLLGGALVLGMFVNVMLVRLALRPLRELQRVANCVSGGALGERAAQSRLADRELSLLIQTTNQMLDKLADDRRRMKELGAEVVFAQEEERAEVARDLHDSVAQNLAAASYQVTGMIHSTKDAGELAKLNAIRELVGSSLEEIRGVSQTLHPRVAQDLGLASALQSLAKSVKQRSLLDVKVELDIDGTTIPSPLAATLFRLAREALRDFERHADAASATIQLHAQQGQVELSVTAYGCGFDQELVLGTAGRGPLKAAHERFSLAGGEMHIDRTPNGGNRIVARITVDRCAA
jgi:signal transduction histidine kinase